MNLCIISDNYFYRNGFLGVSQDYLCLSPDEVMSDDLALKENYMSYDNYDSIIICIRDYRMLLRVFEQIRNTSLARVFIEYNTSINETNIINICNVHIFLKKMDAMEMCRYIKYDFFGKKNVITLRPEKVTSSEWGALFRMMSGIKNKTLSEYMNMSEKTLSGRKCSLGKKMNISRINRGAQLKILYLFSSIYRMRNARSQIETIKG